MPHAIRALALVAALAALVVAAPTAQAKDRQLKVKGGKDRAQAQPRRTARSKASAWPRRRSARPAVVARA